MQNVQSGGARGLELKTAAIEGHRQQRKTMLNVDYLTVFSRDARYWIFADI